MFWRHSTKEIRFTDFSITPGSIEFRARRIRDGQDHTDDLYFHFSSPVVPRHDLIALALSTFCGRSFDKITFELVLSGQTITDIAAFTQATIKTSGTDDGKAAVPEKTNLALSFSGGFDSLAAYSIMPEETKLVSIDFGHWFQRETDFFQNFETNIVSTNFRRLNYDRDSWTFMGVAAILLSDYLQIAYNTFGTNLESSGIQRLAAVEPPGQRVDVAASTTNVTPMSLAGIGDASAIIHGITAVGTAMIVNHFHPELIDSSLMSLASPGSEKLYRKGIIMDIVRERFGSSGKQGPLSPGVDQKVTFDSDVYIDIAYLYILKHRGIEAVDVGVEDYPREGIEIAQSLSLRWFEHVNPVFAASIPEVFKPRCMDRMAQAGLIPYTAEDWQEFMIVRDFLARHNAKMSDALARAQLASPGIPNT